MEWTRPSQQKSDWQRSKRATQHHRRRHLEIGLTYDEKDFATYHPSVNDKDEACIWRRWGQALKKYWWKQILRGLCQWFQDIKSGKIEKEKFDFTMDSMSKYEFALGNDEMLRFHYGTPEAVASCFAAPSKADDKTFGWATPGTSMFGMPRVRKEEGGLVSLDAPQHLHDSGWIHEKENQHQLLKKGY